MNDRNITNARFIQVNQLPQIDSHLTAKLFVDNSIEEPSKVTNTQDNDFNDNKLTNIISITVNTNPTAENGVSTKKHTDESIRESRRVRFNQTLQIYLKVSVGNDT